MRYNFHDYPHANLIFQKRSLHWSINFGCNYMQLASSQNLSVERWKPDYLTDNNQKEKIISWFENKLKITSRKKIVIMRCNNGAIMVWFKKDSVKVIGDTLAGSAKGILGKRDPNRSFWSNKMFLSRLRWFILKA